MDPRNSALRKLSATLESCGTEAISASGSLRALAPCGGRLQASGVVIDSYLDAVRDDLLRALSRIDEYQGRGDIHLPTIEAAWRAVNALGGTHDDADHEARGYSRAIDVALREIDRLTSAARTEPVAVPVACADTFVQVGDDAAVALSDCLAEAPAAKRLVPRLPIPNGSGAMGAVSPRSDSEAT